MSSLWFDHDCDFMTIAGRSFGGKLFWLSELFQSMTLNLRKRSFQKCRRGSGILILQSLAPLWYCPLMWFVDVDLWQLQEHVLLMANVDAFFGFKWHSKISQRLFSSCMGNPTRQSKTLVLTQSYSCTLCRQVSPIYGRLPEIILLTCIPSGCLQTTYLYCWTLSSTLPALHHPVYFVVLCIYHSYQSNILFI